MENRQIQGIKKFRIDYSLEDINLFKIEMFIDEMVEDFKLKMAVIAGASNALKLKVENPRWTDEKVLQKVNKEIKMIISKLED